MKRQAITERHAAPPPPPEPKAWWIRFGPPFAVLVLARGFLALAAQHSGFAPLDASTWARWDSGQYLDITARGYHYAPCPDEPSAFCGNTGWLPAFPYAVRAVSLLGLRPVVAGALVALAFAFALLVLVWTRWLRTERSPRSILTLATVALAVGAIYQHAVFPVSMAAFFAALQADRLVARRFGAASLAGAFAAFSYSTGFLLAPVAAGAILLDRGVPVRRRLVAAAGVATATFAGFAAVLVIQQVEVGAWNAFFLVQARYGHALQSPFATLAAYLSASDPGDGVLRTVQMHILATSLFVVLVMAAGVDSMRRGGSALDGWAALYAAAFFLLPFVFGTAVNPVRSVSFIAPAAVALRRFPALLLAAWLVISAWVAYATGALFFANTIV